MIPNLDKMTQDELMDFWMKYQNIGRRKDCEALIGDRRPKYTVIAGSLGAYAVNRATALGCRSRGDVRAAETYEGICEIIYEKLPLDCKWRDLLTQEVVDA
jgi:hypothetical protein